MVDSTSLMMNGMQQFADANGVPYLAGKVYMYVPNSTTFKDNWQDIDHNALNTTPIVLDAAGRCVIWGTGEYRQILLDRNGNTVWDKITIALTSQEDVENMLAAVISLDDVYVFYNVKPTAGETLFIYNAPRALILPAGLTGSKFSVSVLPTGNTTFTLYKNTGSIGTITFSSAGAVTINFPNTVVLAENDQLSLVAPNPADATANLLAFTFVFTVV